VRVTTEHGEMELLMHFLFCMLPWAKHSEKEAIMYSLACSKESQDGF
jgi:hypothetical protein